MRRTSYEDMNCSVAQCLEVVGEWWSLLILRDAFLGIRRFDDFQARLGISRNVLNQRLRRLVEHGVLERVPYQEHPPRHEYRLTDKGRDLENVPHPGQNLYFESRRENAQTPGELARPRPIASSYRRAAPQIKWSEGLPSWLWVRSITQPYMLKSCSGPASRT